MTDILNRKLKQSIMWQLVHWTLTVGSLLLVQRQWLETSVMVLQRCTENISIWTLTQW